VRSLRPACAAVAATVVCLAGPPIRATPDQAPAARAQPAAPGRPADRVLDATPLHYQLTVTPDFGTAAFDGDLSIDFRVDKPTEKITLDAVNLDVYDAEIFLPYERRVRPSISVDAAGGTVTITAPARLYPGTLKLHLLYSGKIRNDGRGFYLARSHGRKYLLSQMEATDARRAFPCVDDPAFKASVAVSAVVDQRLTAISNGKLISDTAAEKYGKHLLRFGTTPRMSTYLVALAVGEFGCLESSAESVPIRVCAVPENKDRGAFVLEAARRAFQSHARYFTFKYPFRKLDLVAVPGGFPGAMENSGAVFFDEGMLVDPAEVSEAVQARIATAISHEVAHQWLGDVVTMRSWDDLWLNEGLATWIESKPVAAWKPSWHAELAHAASARRAMRVDAMGSARAARSPMGSEAQIEESFDEVAYDKAAAVLRMVEAWVGADVFRNAINAFVRAHAYENVTGEDLWNALAAVAEKPVDQVMRAYLTRPGLPVVTVQSSCDATETIVTATVRRSPVSSNPIETPTETVSAVPPVPAAGPVTPLAAAGIQSARKAVMPVAPQAPSSAWPVPLQVRGINPTAPMLIFTPRLLADDPQSFRIGGCFPAVFVNSGATGYFVTAYRADALAQLTALASARMTPAERIRLLDDQWTLAAAGLSDIGDYLAVVAALSRDDTPEVMEDIADGLSFLRDHVVGEASSAPFDAWVKKTLGPTAAALGWKAAAEEPEDRRRLRAAVVSILGRAGRDRDAQATARTLFAADVAGAQRLDRELRGAVISVAARSADAEMLETMRRRDAEATLAAAGDPRFVVRALDDALRDAERRQELPGLTAAGLRNPAAAADVWKFVTERWSEIQPAFANHLALAEIVTASGSACNLAARNDVQRFFADKTSSIARTLQLSLDRIDACRDFRIRQEGPLASWLAAGSPTPPRSH
jgi:aminopeptidase N